MYDVKEKYSGQSCICAGNINADINRANPHKNDKLCKVFCKENYLNPSPCTPPTPTFYHFNGMSTSCIDLFVESMAEQIISNITVDNTGPLDPVTAKLHVNLPSALILKCVPPPQLKVREL